MNKRTILALYRKHSGVMLNGRPAVGVTHVNKGKTYPYASTKRNGTAPKRAA